MPTENRSSNTEMVSFPRELSDDLGELIAHRARVCGGGAFEIWEAICEGFGQAVTQPHPDPIAWMVGTAFWWTKEEAERDAAATGLSIVGLGPMTDSGEVEQLREVIKHSDEQIMRQSLRISNQRTQLAERDALLRVHSDHIATLCDVMFRHGLGMEKEAEQKIYAALKQQQVVFAALSASAAPEAKS